MLDGDSKVIHEEHSENEFDGRPLEEEEEEDEEEPEEDEDFDFGKAKMDYFKQRAKDILMNEEDIEYDGLATQLGMCFKNLKNAIRNPVVVHAGSDHKPHYLKMTFSTARQAVNGDRYLEMSKLLRPSDASLTSIPESQKVPALMRAGKEMQGEDLMMLTSKKKTKKEEMIDKKIEYLLETYKKQDEALVRKASEKSAKVKADRKNLRDKFGFSDDEEDDDAAPKKIAF